MARNLIVFGALMAMLEFAFMAAGIPAAVYLASVGLALIVLGAVSRWAPRTCSVAALIVFVVGHGAVALFHTRPLVGGWFCNAPTLFVIAFAVLASFEIARPRRLRDDGLFVAESRSPIPMAEAPAPVSIPRSRDAFVEKSFAERRGLSLWVVAASIIMDSAAG